MNISSPTKGITVNPQEHPAQKPSAATGFRALLSSLFTAKGTSAPEPRLPVIGLMVLAVFATMALAAAPALASKKYAPAVPPSFGPEGLGTGNGELKEPAGVAVNDSTEPLMQPAAGDVYVNDGHGDRDSSVAYFSSAGVELGRFESPPGGFGSLNDFSGEVADSLRGIAVDNSADVLDTSVGDVYVVVRGVNGIQEIEAPTSGGYQISFGGQTTASVPFNATQAEVSAALEALSTIGPGNVAIRGTQGHYTVYFEGALAHIDVPSLTVSAGSVQTIFEGGPGVIDKFSSTGSYLGRLTETTGGSPLGAIEAVAVDTSGNLWVYEREELNGKEEGTQNGIVDEFSDTGTFVKAFKTEQEGGRAIAVDSSGNVYVSSGGHVLKFDGATGAKLAEFGEPASALAVDPSTENLLVVPARGSGIALYGPSPGNSSTPIETFPSTGLKEPNVIAVNGERTAYVSHNETGNLIDVFDYVLFPAVELEAASSVTQTAAMLNGTVDPDEAEAKIPGEAALTACRFEYGTEAGSFTNTAECTPPGPSIVGEQHVSAHLTGLQGGTVYHYRLSATNAAGRTEHSQEAAFLTAGPGIAEESVSGVSSDAATLDALVNPNGAPTTYYFQYSTASTAGCTANPSACTDVPAPPGAAIGSGSGVVEVGRPVQGLQASTVYHYRVIAHNSFGGAGGSTIEGPDQTFTTQGPGGPLALPDGRAWEMVSPAQKLGAQVQLDQGSLAQASEDGGAISYPITAPFVASPAGNVKLAQALSRRTSTGWSTEDIATPYTKPTLVGETRGEYRLFSADLSYALVEPFGDNPLTPEGKEGSIYVRDDNTGAYALLTETESQWYEEMDQKQVEETVRRESGFETCDASTDPANGSPVVGSGADGCIVYFVSGQNSQAPTLHVAAGDSAGAWTVSFIATLSVGDRPDWEPHAKELPGTQTGEVSPDGRYLAFMSERSLTGYDNRDASSGESDEEVYRFHYEPGAPAGGSLVCASCDPTGARPAGWRLQRGLSDVAFGGAPWTGRWVAATILGKTEAAQSAGSTSLAAFYESRYMLDNGRLFFDSHDALVPQDINGVNDVYEYESGATGGCSAASGGCVALLSGGTGPEESAFVDASSSGDDVFFVTADKLAPQDVGDEYDMYDAHVCSAEVPCPASLAQSPPCTNEASCRPPQVLQPGVFGPSGSATFSGPGNQPGGVGTNPSTVVKPKTKTVKCKKGDTKNKKGKCVKKTKKSKKAKKTNRRAK
jgi:hypothetical protein